MQNVHVTRLAAALLLISCAAAARGSGRRSRPCLRIARRREMDEGRCRKSRHLRGVALADLDAIFKGDRNQSVRTTVFDIIDKGCAEGWYVDVFRLTVHPEVSDETGSHGWLHYVPDEYFTRILDPAVQYVIAKGKYAVIDWHYVGADWRQPEVAANTEAFWLGRGAWPGIAAKYANNPNVLFELFNEPGAGRWTDWKKAAQGWIEGIRSRGADNIVIVGGPTWSQVMPRRASDLIPGANIAYACHIYPAHAWAGMPRLDRVRLRGRPRHYDGVGVREGRARCR